MGSIGPKAQSARAALKAAADDPALRDEAEWALRRIAGHLERLSRHPLYGAFRRAPLQTTVVNTGNPPVDWDTTTGRNIVWSVALGRKRAVVPWLPAMRSMGTDNARHMNPAYQEDAGVLMAFHAKDGQFLWQDVAPRVERGLREFLLPSTTSAPYVEGNRLCTSPPSANSVASTHRVSVMARMTVRYRDEVFQDNAAADIVWNWTCVAAWVSSRMKPLVATCCRRAIC